MNCLHRLHRPKKGFIEIGAVRGVLESWRKKPKLRDASQPLRKLRHHNMSSHVLMQQQDGGP